MTSSPIIEARAGHQVMFGLSVFLTCAPFIPAFPQLELLKDVNTSEETFHNEYSFLTNAGKYIYFASNNELWKSNGTTRYTVRMKAFKSIRNLTMSGGTLFFTADDGLSGPELWRSNGSAYTTVKVKEIAPGPVGSNPEYLTDVDGVLFFAAYSPDKGVELWKSDGTESGTMMVKDISRGSSKPRNLRAMDGAIYFAAHGPEGVELWKSNGTPENTMLLKDIVPGIKSSNPGSLTVSNHLLFFLAFQQQTGRELWASDGTVAGTRLVRDVLPGSLGSKADNLTHANGRLMFSAEDGIHGYELWESDGTYDGTKLSVDLNPGRVGSNHTSRGFIRRMGHFKNVNGLLYFIASKGTTDYVYRSDGTNAGTVRVTEVISSTVNGPSPAFTYRNGFVYFFNEDGFSQIGLYRMPYKGKLVDQIAIFQKPLPWWPPGAGNIEDVSVINEMISFPGAVYFFARPEPTEGYAFIRSDGTAQGTTTVADSFVPTESISIQDMLRVDDLVYMIARAPLSVEGWLLRTDGTPQGTIELRPEREQSEWLAVGSTLYFIEMVWDKLQYRWQLSKTNGTPETTRRVFAWPGNQKDVQPKGLISVERTIYFYNDLGEVWKSDGTEETTLKIGDFTDVRTIAPGAGFAFILSANESGELEVWRTTSSGLVRVKTLAGTKSAGRFVEPVISIDGILYFVGGSLLGYQLFRSDGTEEGTEMMFGPNGIEGGIASHIVNTVTLLEFKDHLLVSNSQALFRVSGDAYEKVTDLAGHIEAYVTLNDKLFISVNRGTFEVFVTDGSVGHPAQRLITVPVDFGVVDFATVGDFVYFSAFYYDSLWRSDGTVCGTSTVDLGADYAFTLEGLGDDLVFAGYVLATGREPHIYRNVNAMPGPDCPDYTRDPMNAKSTSVDEVLTSFPNPFAESFTFKVTGANGDLATVEVYSATGMPVQRFESVATNIEYTDTGTPWPTGCYIIKVRRGSVMRTYHVIKK